MKTLQGKTDAFKTFPEFSKLTFSDRTEYEKLIADMPPIGDIQFSALMTWWDSLDGARVSLLNGNLVIQYWRPGDEDHSGLSLLGTNRIDESICEIFDHLRSRGEPARLVNVPDFVLQGIEYSELYDFHEERWFDEYVLDTHKYYPLERMHGLRRRRVERQLRKIGNENLKVASIDLSRADNVNLLMKASETWWWRNLNNFGRIGLEALQKSIRNADAIGLYNTCVFDGDKLLGFCLYHHKPGSDYAVLTHVKATDISTVSFEFMAYALAKWFSEMGVRYGNMTEDWGSVRLRMFLMTLGPCQYFHKYTIKPAKTGLPS